MTFIDRYPYHVERRGNHFIKVGTDNNFWWILISGPWFDHLLNASNALKTNTLMIAYVRPVPVFNDFALIDSTPDKIKMSHMFWERTWWGKRGNKRYDGFICEDGKRVPAFINKMDFEEGDYLDKDW